MSPPRIETSEAGFKEAAEFFLLPLSLQAQEGMLMVTVGVLVKVVITVEEMMRVFVVVVVNDLVLVAIRVYGVVNVLVDVKVWVK